MQILRSFFVKMQINIQQIRKQINDILENENLPIYDDLLSLCNDVISVLETEDSDYRPTDSLGNVGGLLELKENIPVIVIPDLHARGSFLRDILNYEIEYADETKMMRKTVLELLAEGKIYLCCVGDIFHSEGRAKERWLLAYEDFCAYYYDDKESSIFLDSKYMNEEMRENLSLSMVIFLLKKCFPKHFHVLKGNHENIKNATYNSEKKVDFGNRAFRKFCEEGIMCTEFIRNYYDDLILYCISCFENTLPICAVFKNCIVSHAEPYRPFTKEEIIDGLTNDGVIYGLTWTANDEAINGSVEQTIKNLFKKNKIIDVLKNPTKSVVWIGGHRPVIGKYATRQNGLYIQIHNPDEENIAIVPIDRKFNPDKDIFDVNNK